MRIAFFTDAFPPQFNGVVSYVFDNATALVRRGHKVIVFAPKPGKGVKSDISAYPFEVRLVPSVPAFVYPDVRLTIPSLPRILLDLKRNTVDIVHVQDPLTVCTEGIMAAKILKLPIIITFHTFFMDAPMLEDFRLGRLTPYIQTPIWRLTAYYHNLANAVICPTRIAQKELRSNGLRKKSIYIPHGINLQTIHPLSEKERIRKRSTFGISSMDPVALYAGRLAVDKSIDIIILAFKKVVDKIPAAKLILVGSGPEEKNLRALAQRMGIEKNILFTGWIEREEIVKSGIFGCADIYVTASKIENLSYSILEAMAFGLPIIGANIRGIPELVDGTNGILVPPDDPDAFASVVVQVLNDSKLREKYRNGSVQKIKQFDMNQTIVQLEKVYIPLLR